MKKKILVWGSEHPVTEIELLTKKTSRSQEEPRLTSTLGNQLAVELFFFSAVQIRCAHLFYISRVTCYEVNQPFSEY